MASSYRSFKSILAEHAHRFPDKIFLHSIHQDQSITYGELFALSNRIAHFLDDAGICANDRVLVLADNSIECAAVYLGVLRHGATVALINLALNRAHLADQVAAVAPKLLLYREGLDLTALGVRAPAACLALGSLQRSTGLFAELAGRSEAGDRPSLAGPEDHASIFYTSGTTAKPKGVIYSHSTLFHNFDAVADGLQLSDSDRVLEFRALSWISPQLNSFGSSLVRGASMFLARDFSAFSYFDWLRSFRITVGFCIPVGINLLLERGARIGPQDLPHLRFMTSSSAPLPVEQWRRFEATFGIKLAAHGGTSECGLIAATHCDNRRIGAVGRPVKYQQVRVLDRDGRALGPGEIGEIYVGGGKQQADAFLSPDGRLIQRCADSLSTGDLGYLDRDGYLWITGRIKDVVIRAGINIAPAEIDEILIAHPGIDDAATVGVADQVYGQRLVCYVVRSAGSDLGVDEVLAHCRGTLPKIKVPSAVEFVDALPRTERGKVNRNALAVGG
jgi:acyl-coenzyme A synthetase/AMP-(fatty) acid ligase